MPVSLPGICPFGAQIAQNTVLSKEMAHKWLQ
jgi:hypothetical protein